MGAKPSKRSVDIAGKAAEKNDAPEERLEKLEEPEVGAAKVQNGSPPTTQDLPPTESPQESGAGGDVAAVNENSNETTAEAVSPATEAAPLAKEGEKEEEKKEEKTPKTPEEEKAEKKKNKEKKKKWSFRSISFSRKDKSKPNVSREDSKSGDLAKEAPVAEAGEAEAAAAVAATTEEANKPTETEKKEAETQEQAAPPNPSSESQEKKEEKAEIVESSSSKVEESKESKSEEEVVRTSEVVSSQKLIQESSSVEVSNVKEFHTTTTVTTMTVTEKIQELGGERKLEEIPPPLPASPPPTEAPPPTPVAPVPQSDQEEVNGGGESMAEMPEENGLVDGKVDDDEEPKVNGHCDQSPMKEIVDSIIEKVEVMKISVENSDKTEMAENNVETTNEVASVEE